VSQLANETPISLVRREDEDMSNDREMVARLRETKAELARLEQARLAERLAETRRELTRLEMARRAEKS